jgi:hypothetical protein
MIGVKEGEHPMNPNHPPRGVALRCGLVSGLCLCGGLLLGLGAGIAISGLPMHMPERTRNLIAALPVFAILIAASAAWGYAMGRNTGSSKIRRMAWAGALSFTPSLLLAAIMLGRLEVAIVERGGGPDLPVHVVFTLLFVPAAFLVAGVGGIALGLAQGDARLAGRMGLAAALAGGLAFLVVNVVMDALGYRVGAPGAAERFTMLTVMMAGNLGAALAGGAVIGVLLRRHILQGALVTPLPSAIEAEAA